MSGSQFSSIPSVIASCFFLFYLFLKEHKWKVAFVSLCHEIAMCRVTIFVLELDWWLNRVGATHTQSKLFSPIRFCLCRIKLTSAFFSYFTHSCRYKSTRLLLVVSNIEKRITTFCFQVIILSFIHYNQLQCLHRLPKTTEYRNSPSWLAMICATRVI